MALRLSDFFHRTSSPSSSPIEARDEGWAQPGTIVMIRGEFGRYGGVILEADAERELILIRWYNRKLHYWAQDWWSVSRVQPMTLDLSPSEKTRIARELIETGSYSK